MVSGIPAGTGKTKTFFYSVDIYLQKGIAEREKENYYCKTITYVHDFKGNMFNDLKGTAVHAPQLLLLNMQETIQRQWFSSRFQIKMKEQA